MYVFGIEKDIKTVKGVKNRTNQRQIFGKMYYIK